MDINSVPMVLCNLYAPNIDDLDFFKTLTMHIAILELETIVLDGDFIFIVTYSLDNWKTRNYFVDWAENKCLVDV